MDDWIERYVHAIGEKLPRNQREDIKKELSAALHDTLDERFKAKPPTEEDIKAVIKEFGSPSEVADRYRPAPRYLIGPDLFGLYKLVLGIALAAMVLGLTVAVIVGALADGSPFSSQFPGLLGAIAAGGLSAIGSVTLVFFLIQMISAGSPVDAALNPKDWQPEDLPPLPDSGEGSSLAESVMTIVFTLIALTVFNLFPDKIAVYNFSEAGFAKLPIFNIQTLRPYVWAMSGVWTLQLLIAFHLLTTKKRTVLLRMANIFASLAGLAILLLAAGNAELLNPEALAFFPSALTGIFRAGGRLLILFIVVITLFDIGKSLLQIRKSL